jgi:hypothetical protein
MLQVPEKLGDRIRGSRFYRNFCSLCGDPIRVTEERRFRTKQSCECCRPHPMKVMDNARRGRLYAD